MGWRDDPIAGESQQTQAPPAPPQFGGTQEGAVTGLAFPRRALPEQPEPSFQEAWRSDPVVGPTGSQKLGAIAQGATGGFIEGAPAVGGAVMGAKLGSLLGPLGTAGGALLGGIAGGMAGKTLREYAAEVPLGDSTLTTKSVEAMPEELRPYGYGGEFVGAGAPMVAAPFAAGTRRLPEFQGAKITPYVNRVIESAQQNPAAFIGSEAAGLGAAGLAGGVAEAYAPGNTPARVGAELVGGFFNPTRWLVSASGGANNAARNFLGSFTRTGRENRAAAQLQDIVTKFGEDPAALAKALKEANLPGVNVTAAQKTGSPALIALEARLAHDSAKFGAESRKMAEDSLSTMKNLMVALEGTGDPAALKAAAEVRSRYFSALINGRLQTAEREALEKASQITRDDPLVRTQLSKDARTALENALTQTRGVERSLWDKVPQEIPLVPNNTLSKFDELKAQMLPEESFPPAVEVFIRRMREGKSKLLGPKGEALGAGESSTGEMLLLRSRMLQYARDAAAKGALNEARMYGELAESALDDLSAISASVPEIAHARQFSKELNDAFTRTFAGEALAAKAGGGGRATGADRIPPELLMLRAYGSGREAGALRFKQLEEATAFLKNKGISGPEADRGLDIMLDAQSRILRLSAAESINPVTGRVSPIKLSKFISDHAEVLERFPDVRKTLQEALKSETKLTEFQRMAEGASKAIDKKAAFSKVIKYDSPADAVRSALSGNTPAKDFIALTNLAKRSGTDAVEGLRYSAWEDAIRKSTTDTGELSFKRLQATLFNPVRPGQPSLVQMLKSQGVMSAGDVARAEEILKRAIRVQDSMFNGGNLSELVQSPDALFDLVVRIAGAKVGAAAAGIGGQATSGHTLVAAGRGSTYARKIFEKIPQVRTTEVLIEAMTNPQFGALLLSKPTSRAEALRIARQMHAYAFQAGLTYDKDDSAPDEPSTPQFRGINSTLIPNKRPDRYETTTDGVRG